MTKKERVAQLVLTVSEDERVEWEKLYVRLLSEAKRRGGRVLKKNDLTKLAFRLGMNVIRQLSYPAMLAEVRWTEEAHTIRRT